MGNQITYNLSRRFSIFGFLGISVIAAAQVGLYLYISGVWLVKQEERANAEMSRAIANSIWPRYHQFFANAENLSTELLIGDPQAVALREDVMQRIEGLRIVKIKIYTQYGRVAFSTDRSQIGTKPEEGRGLLRALNGMVSSELTHRDEFSSFEGVIFDRDLVSSYIPVIISGQVVGVVEIYSDVSSILYNVETMGNMILALVTGMLLLLYIFLLMVVHRGDKIIKVHQHQEEALQRTRLHYVETHDLFTGLLNRNGFIELLNGQTDRIDQDSESAGVVSIRLERLKYFQDTLGQATADNLLSLVAERIRDVIGEKVELAQIESNELAFVIFEEVTPLKIQLIIAELRTAFARPFYPSSMAVTIPVSFGAAVRTGEHENMEDLWKNATIAMNHASVSITRDFFLFDQELEESWRKRLELEIDIGRAVMASEFELYYQPRVDSATGLLVAVEALLRWNHPDKGMIQPDSFIPLLEETGYIIEVGEWLIGEACRQGSIWHKEGRAGLRISVNISAKQFQSSQFLEVVRTALVDSGFNPASLELEITESIFISDPTVTAAVLHELKGLGVSLSLDDFGTGYSSLSYLMHFPLDCIKIDKSFITDLMVNQDHNNLTRAIILMARSLRLKVVAEGVETQEQDAMLREMGCDEIQGFYYSRPIAAGNLPYSFSGHQL